MSVFTIKTFYSFAPQAKDQLEAIKQQLNDWSEEMKITGLIILSVEGLNTTLSGQEDSLELFIEKVKGHLNLGDVVVKTSTADFSPFKRFNVKIRSEIVTLDRRDINPSNRVHRHISPEEWDKLLQQEDTICVDTRNYYETEVGMFKNAVDLKIDEFTEFPEKMKSAEWDRDKTYLIYCTGGIRCEKAIYAMEDLGYKNVYQLDGGILNYLQQKPNENFEGECFVFDSRVSVDQNLEPSKQYSLCPHCGDVAKVEITCRKCDSTSKLCQVCSTQIHKTPELETCSKNCAYHYKRDPESKMPQQKRHYHFA